MCQQALPTAQRGIFQATVLENNLLCLDHYQLILRLDRFPPTRPGQFVTIRCGQVEPIRSPHEVSWETGRLPQLGQPELAGHQPLLRRPFSLAGRRDVAEAVELEIIHHVIGVGTAWLAQTRPGEAIEVLGPLGNGFDILPAPRALVIGGGVGIPPMLYLAERLAAAGKKVIAIAGARTRALLPLTIDPAEPPSTAGWPAMSTAEFAARSTPTIVATDDGTLGVTGFVSVALEQFLDRERPGADELAVYACGPAPMLKSIAAIALSRGHRCQVALERHMGCGMGTCQSCIVKVKSALANAAWEYKLVCKDGPVFDAADLVW